MEEIKLSLTPEWGRGDVQSIDFIVTEDCNLRCKYCYICHKKADKVMDFTTAKKFIDYFFSNRVTREKGVILGFIGGEPFLEVDLIDKIVDYFKIKSFKLGIDWWWNYRISITTNGLNYHTPKVQRFIRKNHEKLSITITIDGTREKHDLQRVFPDGRGSYDAIEKNIPLYLSQFPGTTKVTFASDDLRMLKDSIIHLWKMGIYDISANVVFEDVWKEGDDKIFESQLRQLADYMIENSVYEKNFVSLFDDYIGKPLTEEHMNRTSCGAGRMLAIGPSGNIYPCLRYKDYSLESGKDEVVIGHVDSGINFDKVLRFRVSTYPMQCDTECLECEIALGCMFCQGQSYDAADTDTNFQRSKSICKMHKARVRANNYYFNRLYNERGIKRNDYNNEFKKMYFITSSNYVDFCEIHNGDNKDIVMDRKTLIDGLEYCAYNFFNPVFLHSRDNIDYSLFDYPSEYKVTHILSANYYEETKKYKDIIYVFDEDTYDMEIENLECCILNLSWDKICDLSKIVKKIFENVYRVNLNLIGIPKLAELNSYEIELEKIKEYIFELWMSNSIREFNKITDVLFMKKQETCKFGVANFSISPEGKFYICPHSYNNTDNQDTSIGELSCGIIRVKNQKLYKLEHAVLCNICPAKHCVRCSKRNKEETGEVNVPPSGKCRVSLMEYSQSVNLAEKIKEIYPDFEMLDIKKFNYKTPYEKYEDITKSSLGFHVV